jgi:BatD DUF11 like domain
MVIRFFLIFLLLPIFLFSATFTASVNRNQVGIGESFNLILTLKDATAKSTPQIESLQSYFQIHSQQQSSNTTIINGKAATSLNWKYVLLPKHEGEMIIPAINVETSEGLLSTQPTTIRVVKEASHRNEGQTNPNATTISTAINNKKPYKNEPFFYTIRLTSKQPLVNLQMAKFNVENAIVEMAGEPKSFEKIGNGKPEGVVEFNYAITPLKSGQLKIPPVTIQGAIPVRRTLSSFFQDAVDFADLMQGFEQWQPIALTTEEAVVDVQPSIAEVNPWLPAKSLAIEEIWDEKQPIQAGELFSRGVRIVAEGINANQLPSLSDRQLGDYPLKMYADKPELATDIGEGTIKSKRIEQYTLIPQQAGTMVLPEITVAWWDVEHKKKMVSTLPARTVLVLPALEKELINKPEVVEETLSIQPTMVISEDKNVWLYVVIGSLLLLLMLIGGWCLWLQRKMNRMLHPIKEIKPVEPKKSTIKIVSEKKAPKSKKEELNDLNPT